ncbi:hypothetical protein GCM10023116_21220 [Kistimonas scapharcae]|uniref:Uncharacterized protein n=1 Tax=Kistimonas scapharcae TaxID=1036133 RepID=A0ABP8V1M7_9GAMM
MTVWAHVLLRKPVKQGSSSFCSYVLEIWVRFNSTQDVSTDAEPDRRYQCW